MNIKENVKDLATWRKGFFIVVFGIVFYLLCSFIWILVVFQFITKVFTGNPNKHVHLFGRRLTSYTMQIFSYVLFQSNDTPFPFSPLPNIEQEEKELSGISPTIKDNKT